MHRFVASLFAPPPVGETLAVPVGRVGVALLVGGDLEEYVVVEHVEDDALVPALPHEVAVEGLDELLAGGVDPSVPPRDLLAGRPLHPAVELRLVPRQKVVELLHPLSPYPAAVILPKALILTLHRRRILVDDLLNGSSDPAARKKRRLGGSGDSKKRVAKMRCP